jgi:hypothetical protein
MDASSWILQVEFLKNARYTASFTGAEITEYGDLNQAILHKLKDAFVDPLPRPQHLVIKNAANEVITPDNWRDTFQPDRDGRTLYISQGRPKLRLFSEKSAEGFRQTGRPRSSLSLSATNGKLLSAFCYSLSSCFSCFAFGRKAGSKVQNKRLKTQPLLCKTQ